VLAPAGWLAGALAASWLGALVDESTGISLSALPGHLLRALPLDYLLFSAPAPETRALLLALAGLGLFAAARAAARDDPRFTMHLTWAIAGSTAVLGLASLGVALGQWASADMGSALLAHLRAERVVAHLPDPNAAASHYVLGALAAGAVVLSGVRGRAPWGALLIATMIGLALTGSRTAWLATLVMAAVGVARATGLAWAQQPWRLAAAATALVTAALAAVLVAGADAPGSAGLSLRIRGQFLETSAAMFASAPVYGVGVDHYHERSATFMPAELRALYPFENAHNYAAQVFAELGVVGGLLFLWLVAAAVRAAWPGRGSAGPWRPALWAAATGYLVTCLAGHPLLVPESALPFWIVLGASAAPAAVAAPSRWRRLAALTIVPVLLAGAGLDALARPAAAATRPPDEGFFPLEAGTPLAFRWTTRHAVAWVEGREGFLRIPVQAPELDRPRPWEVEVAVGGRVQTVERVPPGQWLLVELPVRAGDGASYTRVDLRVNQDWSPARDRGEADDDAPRGIMVGPLRFTAEP
jgi:O-antigen ligase